MATENCYVCGEQLLKDDKQCRKLIDEVKRHRHFWHGVPGITKAAARVKGIHGYALTLEDAKTRAEYYLNNNPYAAPELKADEKAILDEVNRLLIKRQPEPPY